MNGTFNQSTGGLNVSQINATTGYYEANVSVFDGTDWSANASVHFYLYEYVATDCETLQANNGNINDGSTLIIEEVCDLGSDSLNVNDGTLYINSPGKIIATGCSVSYTATFAASSLACTN